MDDEMRDALDKFVSAWVGEKDIEGIVKGLGITREAAIESLMKNVWDGDPWQFFEKYHEKHGTYPEPKDLGMMYAEMLNLKEEV